MTAKYFFLLIIAIIATACAPIVNEVQQPANPNAASNAPTLIPVTGKVTAESSKRELQTPRLWSGEISTSDNFPNLNSDSKVSIKRQTATECISEDSQPRAQSGCLE